VSYERLGNVAEAQRQLAEAARIYGEGLAIRKKLAAGDPSNTEWQRDLYATHWRLADLAEKQNKPTEARNHWQHAHDVLAGIDKRGLHVAPEDREYLEILRKKLAAR
jgi:tetratricopeptide (TPR) repeat protein